MEVKYRLMKNNNKQSHFFNQFYAKAAITDEVDLNTLAERIQRNCSMKKSDVLAVLTELVEVMKDELQASHAVRINGLGVFKVGIKGNYVAKAEDFNPAKNIHGYKVNFRPSFTTVKTGTYFDATASVIKVKKAVVTELTKDITVKPL